MRTLTHVANGLLDALLPSTEAGACTSYTVCSRYNRCPSWWNPAIYKRYWCRRCGGYSICQDLEECCFAWEAN